MIKEPKMDTVTTAVALRSARRCRLVAVSAPILFAALIMGTGAATAQQSKSADDIFGSWLVSCENAKGQVVEITGSGETAVGKIKTLGLAARFHYKVGEEILRLKKTDTGWSGELLWKNTIPKYQRWQPITFTLEDGHLRGVTANEYCYKNMTRVE